MGVTVRATRAQDRDALDTALRACGAFTTEEVRVALEMIDGGLQGDYSLFTVLRDGSALGYVCLGRAPLTESTWYLYWICVHPEAQGLGVGRALQEHAELFVVAEGGRRIVLETSGRPGYARTREFYERAGFSAVGHIPQFYATGDDCVVYCKELVGPFS